VPFRTEVSNVEIRDEFLRNKSTMTAWNVLADGREIMMTESKEGFADLTD